MGFPYRLVATDLDGTLLRSDETISRRTRDALAAAAAEGAVHVVATGRSVPWTRHILEDLGYTGLAVCGQGAQLYSAGEDRLLTSVTLDRGVGRRVVARMEEELGPLGFAASRDGLAGEVVTDPTFLAWDVGGSADIAGSAPQATTPLREADRAELWAEPVIKLYARHPEWGDDRFAAVARDLVGDEVGVVISGEGLVELLPLGLSKARGLSLAARRLGVTAAEAIAFGDMPNDLPMLRWAAHGVAMAGAHPEVLAVADEVTAGNDAEGIAKVIERLLNAS